MVVVCKFTAWWCWVGLVSWGWCRLLGVGLLDIRVKKHLFPLFDLNTLFDFFRNMTSRNI